MQRCSRCQLEVPETYRLCPQCGTQTLATVDNPADASNPAPSSHSTSRTPANNLSSQHHNTSQSNLPPTSTPSSKQTLTDRSLASALPKRRKSKRIPILKPWAVVALGLSCVFIFLMIFKASDSVAMWAVNNTSVADEQALIKVDVEEIIHAARDASDPEAQLVNDIGQNLVNYIQPQSPYPYHFYLVPDDELNAFALPGGYIVIFEGLYQHLTSEETAAVLSHEIIHVENQHGLKAYYKSLSTGLLIAWVLGFNDDIGKSAVNYLTDIHYGRELETEADIEGVKLMQRAGYDPQDMINLMNKMDDLDGDGLVDRIPSWLLSHPQSRERAAAIEEVINE